MNEEEYISGRVDEQIAWYDHKSMVNQLFYKRIQLLQIICSSLVVLLVGFITEAEAIKWLIGVLSMFVAISTALNGLYKFQENWIAYRTTTETLKHNKYLYLTRATPYDTDDAFEVFVKSTEECISQENSNWSKYIKHVAKEN